jgi:sigma-E factor negative regulatory protein RseC
VYFVYLRIAKEIYFCSRFLLVTKQGMSAKPKTVDHQGKVQEITSNDVLVKIVSHSACSSCHAKGACGVSDTAEKIVVVHKASHNFLVGQDVKVILKQSLGFKALLWGYVFPFFVVLFSLILLTSFGVPEARAGLASLAMLLPYYFGLYAFRDRLSKQFTFDIETI